MKKPLIGISACLLGSEVRYDGGHKQMLYLKDLLSQYVDFVALCPEVDSGMTIPREAMRVVLVEKKPRLLTQRTKEDKTEMLLKWSSSALVNLEDQPLCGYILKSKSPSCGLFRVKEYREDGVTDNNDGMGFFAKAFTDRFPFIPVEEDGRLNDSPIRENFIERIFAMFNWYELVGKTKSAHALTTFYASYKYMLMAHSPSKQKELGSLLGHITKENLDATYTSFFELFITTLKEKATLKKNTNVLDHIMGYFKPHLSAEEKQELREVIDQYHNALIPIIVPITLLKHYVYKYKEPYLMDQYFLSPHPMELMLRNHV